MTVKNRNLAEEKRNGSPKDSGPKKVDSIKTSTKPHRKATILHKRNASDKNDRSSASTPISKMTTPQQHIKAMEYIVKLEDQKEDRIIAAIHKVIEERNSK